MKYQQRPGIVITKICKRFVLIPTRAASKECRQIMPLSLVWATIWNMIGSQAEEAELLKMLSVFRKKPTEELRQELTQFCENLRSRGFLIMEEDS